MLNRLPMLFILFLPLLAPAGQPPVQEKRANLQDQVSEINLLATVEKLVAFGTRHSLSTRGIGEAREWIRTELARTAKDAKGPMSVNLHEFTDPRLRRSGAPVPQKNVYAILKGKRYPKEAIVFGAHYDSLNLTERDPDATAPGANDNASGTAAVLEAARILSQIEPDRTIVFVAFAAEEQGLIGAWHFANFLKNSDLEVVAMLNNDIVGGARDDEGRPLNVRELRCFSAGPQDSASRRLARLAKLVVERRTGGLKLLLQNSTDRPGRGGDHQSFNQHGMAAIRFIEANETDRLHHTPNDMTSRIYPPYHALAVKADIALLANLASAPPAPTTPELKVSGRSLSASWKRVDGAARYLVGIRQGGLEFERFIESSGNSATWQAAAAGGFQVSVAAVNADGDVSLFSPETALGVSQ